MSPSVSLINTQCYLPPAPAPHLFLRLFHGCAPATEWHHSRDERASGANVVKTAEKTRRTKRENETGETKRKSLVQDLKRRHQCVWAVLNNLLLPDQTLFN